MYRRSVWSGKSENRVETLGAKALHDMADEDRDGKLSWAEMKKHAEMLVGGLGGGGHGEL